MAKDREIADLKKEIYNLEEMIEMLKKHEDKFSDKKKIVKCNTSVQTDAIDLNQAPAASENTGIAPRININSNNRIVKKTTAALLDQELIQ